MATRDIFKHLGAGASLLILAGCGGGSSIIGDGGGGGGTPGEPPRAIAYADEQGTASAALAGGTTLEADEMTARSIKTNGRAQEHSASADTFAIARNDQGGVDVTINGKDFSFTGEQQLGNDGWERQDGNDFAGVFTYNFGLDRDLSADETAHSQLWRYILYDDATGVSTDGFTVVGTETRPDALEGKASATYQGYMFGRTRGTTNPSERNAVEAGTFYAYEQSGDRSRVRMNADFDAATIDGDITGILVRARNSDGSLGAATELPGRVIMETASIAGNGYEGALSAADGMMDLGTNATYSGRFYGENAQETGGVMSFEGGDENFAGGFRVYEITP